MKLGEQEKKAVADAWNGIVSLVNLAYGSGIVKDINMSTDVNACFSIIDTFVKEALKSPDCGCDEKKEMPKPQPVEAAQGVTK